MRSLARLLLPLAVAAALLAFAGPLYTRALVAATAAVRASRPLPHAAEVRAEDTSLAVRSSGGAARVPVGPIAWSLSVLLCLWGWVVRGRWGWLVAAVALFVSAHVIVADVQVRASLGGGAGLAYAFARAWVHWLSGASAAFAVGIARATLPPRPPPAP